MGSQDEIFGDVIQLDSSSEDESVSTRKRSHDEADDSDRSSQDGGISLRGAKRVKTKPVPRGGESDEEEEDSETSSSEEGEVGDESEGQAEGQTAHGKPQPSSAGEKTSLSKRTGKAPDTSTGQSQLGTPAIAFMPANPSTFQKLELPSWANAEKSWLQASYPQRFTVWVEVLVANNLSESESITPRRVQEAFSHFVHHKSGLNKKDMKRRATLGAHKVESSGELETLLRTCGATTTTAKSQTETVPAESKSAAKVPTDQQGPSPCADSTTKDKETSTNGARPKHNTQKADDDQNGAPQTALLNSEAMEQQRRYFPSATDPSNMCLLCGLSGHNAATCSHQQCPVCHDGKHSEFDCPSRRRCDKCRQLGHDAAKCEELLALTKDEGLACAFCRDPDHLENECTQVWRSFRPDPETIVKVISMPASCAKCGGDRHFATDCNLGSGEERNPTWTLANRDRYVDVECDALTIEQAAAAATKSNGKPARGEHRIRGHAARTNNVHYSESDDSDVEFLGSRSMKPRGGLGQIHMSSNIQMPSNGRGGRGNGRGRGGAPNQQRGQPPLPPGPPPSGPPGRPFAGQPPPPGAGGYNSHPRGPPPSLPPKPPAGASRDYHNVPPPPSSQGGGGRARGAGGYRGGRFAQSKGRGRGRGRGK